MSYKYHNKLRYERHDPVTIIQQIHLLQSESSSIINPSISDISINKYSTTKSLQSSLQQNRSASQQLETNQGALLDHVKAQFA